MTDQFALATRIVKRDAQRQIAYSVVLEPRDADHPDSQGDYYDAGEIELAAHGFLEMVAKGDAAADLMHDDGAAVGYAVESFIAPVDFMWGAGDRIELVTKGSWVMGIHYPDSDIWAGIVAGEYDAVSVAGRGVRMIEEG